MLTSPKTENMSGVSTKPKNKKNQDTQGKEINQVIKASKLTSEASMASFQSSLDGISRQIQTLQKEMKSDLKTLKDEITTQMRDELTELKGDIDQKFAKITTDIGEQDEKISAALTRTEEIESWSHEANCALQEIMQEQKMDKWLREEFAINSDLQIQGAHRALAPKPKSGQPPRSIVINFQQFTVKEMILKKAWEKIEI